MQLIFEGHACVQIITTNGLTILIDPFIKDNPLCNKQTTDFKPDLVLVTHGHGDHLGDALEICRNSGATLAGMYDLLMHLDTEGIETVGFNTGGSFDFKGTRIIMVAAVHGNNFTGQNAGAAAGFIVEVDDKTIYHAGDTALFGDMKDIIGRYKIDYAFLPIGDFYTMGPADAVIAAHWLGAATVVPIHYNTFPVIAQDVQQFCRALEDKTESRCLVLEPGQVHQA